MTPRRTLSAATRLMPQPAARHAAGAARSRCCARAADRRARLRRQLARAASPKASSAELWAAVPQIAAPRAVEPPPTPAPPQPAPAAEAAAAAGAEGRRRSRRRAPTRRSRSRRRSASGAARGGRAGAARAAEARAQKAERRSRAARKAKRAEREKRSARRREQRRRKQREREAGAPEGRRSAPGRAARGQPEAHAWARPAPPATPTATGTAARTPGPSASYAGRIKARIKPNIVFTDERRRQPAGRRSRCAARPTARSSAASWSSSSGSKEWDEAVLRAIDKTEVLPRDIDGRVPPPMQHRVQAARPLRAATKPRSMRSFHQPMPTRPFDRPAVPHSRSRAPSPQRQQATASASAARCGRSTPPPTQAAQVAAPAAGRRAPHTRRCAAARASARVATSPAANTSACDRLCSVGAGGDEALARRAPGRWPQPRRRRRCRSRRSATSHARRAPLSSSDLLGRDPRARCLHAARRRARAAHVARALQRRRVRRPAAAPPHDQRDARRSRPRARAAAPAPARRRPRRRRSPRGRRAARAAQRADAAPSPPQRRGDFAHRAAAQAHRALEKAPIGRTNSACSARRRIASRSITPPMSSAQHVVSRRRRAIGRAIDTLRSVASMPDRLADDELDLAPRRASGSSGIRALVEPVVPGDPARHHAASRSAVQSTARPA